MKKVRKSKSALLIVLCCLMSLLIALSTVAFVESSFIVIESSDGEDEYSGFSPYTTRIHTMFEDTELCGRIMESEIEQITRLCVIKSQLETNGAYDAKKKIDVVKYSTRNEKIQSNEKSVEFYVDDLVKWGNYGFDYQVVQGSEAQLDSYFYALQSDISKNMISSETLHVDGQDMASLFDVDEGSMCILVSRYKTAEGKDIIEYARNRDEYKKLISALVIASEDLFTNYTEYAETVDRYDNDKTNMVYCYQMNNNGKQYRYTNLNKNVAQMSNDEISKMFTSYGKYICFNPDKLQMASNVVTMDAVTMKEIIGGYDYAFGDNSRIWIALDTGYKVQDAFYNGHEAYGRADNIFPFACIGGIVSCILFILFFVLLTIGAGKVTYINEEGERISEIKERKVDGVALEILLVISFVVICLLICLGALQLAAIELFWNKDMFMAYMFAGLVAALITACILPIYLVFVRKIKCKHMWNGSLLQKFFRFIKSEAIDAYDHGSIVIRTWLPFLLVIFFNIVMTLLGAFFVVIAIAVDIAIGVYLYKEAKTRETIISDINAISEGNTTHHVDTKGMHGENLSLANAVNSIGDGIHKAVETSMKDEKLKADLITNVSHDIKTPLTSIINYVDLIKRENIQDEKIRGYIDILDQKSQRLKALTDDLVEASKISSGAMILNMEKINIRELVNQSLGEFSAKFEEKGLKFITNMPADAVNIMADSRGIYRVIENLYNNIYKYALENTRVYVDMTTHKDIVTLSIKNISAEPLNISAEELMERFTRGDVSRKTEGSGLGLSIAKNLTESMKGTFNISMDADLFKVVIGFKVV